MSKSNQELNHFPECLITEAAEILGVEGDRRKNQLSNALQQLPNDLRLFRSRDAIPQPAKTHDQLNDLATACDREINGKNTRKHLPAAKRLAGLEEAARGLLVYHFALRVEPTNPARAIDDGRAISELIKSSENLKVLRDTAKCALSALPPRSKGKRGGSQHKKDWPLQQIILILGAIYLKLTRDDPGISVDPYSNEPTGRFVRFTKLVLSGLGYNLSLNAIRHNFRENREQEKC